MSITVEEALKDEGFQGLPNAEKVKALLQLPDFQRQAFATKRDLIGKADPTFAQLPYVEQNRALNKLGLGTPLKNAISKAARPILEMGGMMLGEAIGGTAGGSAGAVAGVPGIVAGGATGAFLGGTIGYAGGHEAANAFDTSLGMREPITTPAEAATSTIDSVQQGALFASGGAAIGAGLKVGIPALSAGAANLAKRAGVQGFKLTPAQLMKSKPLALLESYFTKVPFASAIMRKFTGEQSAAIENATQNIMSALGSVETRDDMGKMLQKGLADENFAKLKARDKLYDKFYSMAEEQVAKSGNPTPIKFNNVGEAARKLKSEQLQGAETFQDAPFLKQLEELSDPNKAMSMTGAISLRKSLNGIIGGEVNTAKKYAYQQIKTALDKDIADFSILAGGEIEQALVKANAAHGSAKQLQENPYIQKLVNANPSSVVDAAFNKNFGPTEMTLLRKALPEDSLKKFQSAVVNKLFEGPATNAGIEGLGSYAKNLVKNFQRYGEEPIAAALPQGAVARLKEFADLISKVSMNADVMAGNSAGTGATTLSWASTAGQGYFVVNALKNPSLAGLSQAAATIMTPPVLAKIYLSDIGRKLITDGFNMSAESAGAAALGTKLLAVARREYLQGIPGTPGVLKSFKQEKAPSEESQNAARRGGFVDAIMSVGIPSASANQGSSPRMGGVPSRAPAMDLQLYNSALTAYLGQDYSKARSLATQALKKNPNRTEALRLLERMDSQKVDAR